MIALLAIAARVLVSWKNNIDNDIDDDLDGMSDNSLDEVLHVYVLLESPDMILADFVGFQRDCCGD